MSALETSPAADPPLAWAADGPARDLWGAAAVRERFRTSELLDAWLRDHAPTDPDARMAAMEAALDLEQASIAAQGADGGPALRLPSVQRFQVLQSLGPDATRALVETLPDGDVTLSESLLKTMLSDGAVEPDPTDRDQLTALATVGEWAGAAGAPPGFDPSTLHAQVAELNFLRGMGGPDLDRFVGRATQLSQLKETWDAPWIGPVLVDAPGGMGKSMLVSRFVADRLTEPPGGRPHAVFHLDFDRRDLQRAGLATMIAELLRQAERWIGEEDRGRLADLRQAYRFAEQGSNLETFGASRGEGARTHEDTLRELCDMLGRKEQARIVLFIDSFEQVLGFDDETARHPGTLASMMRRERAKVFDIYASRDFGPVLDVTFQVGRPILGEAPVRARASLGVFSTSEALQLLAGEAARLGVKLDEAKARAALRVVGRSPLAVRLAAILIEKEGPDFDAAVWARSLRGSSERIQAALYDRILLRLHDPDLQRLAKPGLQLRRLTVEVIERVLAGACGIDLRQVSGQALMERAAREGQLFIADPDDPSALWHRPDVRRLMLRDFDRITADQARAVNRAALDYYDGQTGVAARTEALYHALRLNLPEHEIGGRLGGEPAERLKNALTEFPAAARRLLRRRLGGVALADVTDLGASPSRYPARFDDLDAARALLQRQTHDSAARAATLEFMEINELARLDGPAGDLYAEALVAEGRINRLIREADRLSRWIDFDMPVQWADVRAAVFATVAGALEGLGDLHAALEDWRVSEAFSANGTYAPHNTLAAVVGQIRVTRKWKNPSLAGPLRQLDEARIASLKRATVWLDVLGDPVRERPVLARECVAEVSELLLWPTERAPIVDPSLRPIREILDWLVGAGEAFPSIRIDPGRLTTIAVALGMEPDTSFRNMINTQMKRLYDSDGLSRLIPVLQDEVDWTLKRAVTGPFVRRQTD
ncbi:AAA family ATPase [Caulobacter sp. BE254]|uniref:AAA family ATPase n=1 Tax=Caulobacter sp. BE254 TaxID=2817720 RepID=UPI0028613E39|nr:AAA family ATPase [Caulobacter sp. BE254]MDR7117613.1 hypothetical protein [Caulobacter sp. BE254]